MKTIKAIVFGALIVTAIVSGATLFCFLGAVEVTDIWHTVKMFVLNALIFGASLLAIEHLYERWYKK